MPHLCLVRRPPRHTSAAWQIPGLQSDTALEALKTACSIELQQPALPLAHAFLFRWL